MGLFDFLFSKNNTTKYTIPEKYISFPVYNGIMKKKPVETTTDAYDRLTIFYKGTPDETFCDSILKYGFEKATNVRYDKSNTYVIFEKSSSNTTKVAYHIKK